MTLRRNQPQTAAPERGAGNRLLPIMAAVLCALLVLIGGLLLSKNVIYCAAARREAENGEFRSAAYRIGKVQGEAADTLRAYIDLRLEIDNSYPAMLAAFDREKVEAWYETACALLEHPDGLGEMLTAETNRVREQTGILLDLLDDYERLRPEILSMMEIFGEINRLYTPTENGKNPAFTVVEEREKIDRWAAQNERLIAYAATVENAEQVYLLNYLIKETQGECEDLRAAMETVLANGYSETDRIRLTGSQQKSFPGVQNGSVTINLARKEEYETYLYQSICRVLTERLGTLYSAA